MEDGNAERSQSRHPHRAKGVALFCREATRLLWIGKGTNVKSPPSRYACRYGEPECRIPLRFKRVNWAVHRITGWVDGNGERSISSSQYILNPVDRNPSGQRNWGADSELEVNISRTAKSGHVVCRLQSSEGFWGSGRMAVRASLKVGQVFEVFGQGRASGHGRLVSL
jgi:hypothetical protein